MFLRLRLIMPGDTLFMSGVRFMRLMRAGAPAADERRVDQHHAAGEFRMPRGAHQAQEAAERMADEEHRRRPPPSTRVLREIGELLHQVRPVVGDGVLRVVAEFLDRIDLEAAVAQAVEHHAVGARGKAVAVGEDDGRKHGIMGGTRAGRATERSRVLQISFSSGVEILRSGLWRVAGILSGCSV